MIKHFVSLILFFVLGATCAVNAQQHKQVLIDLNTGYQIKGELLEQTPKGIKIKASNGEVYEYKSEEIAKIQDTKQSSSPNKPLHSEKKIAPPVKDKDYHQRAQGTLSYHFGISVPTGNFADETGVRAGGAGLGLNFGVQYLYPLSEEGLSLFAGIDLDYNGLKKSYRDDIENEYDSDVDLTFPKYLNIPVSGGLHYTYVVNEKACLYGKGGLVASILKVTNSKVSYSGDEVTKKYDLSTNLGFMLGGGLILNDKIDVAVSYWGLGEHEIKGEMDYGNGDIEKLDRYKLDDSLVTLTIGFEF